MLSRFAVLDRRGPRPWMAGTAVALLLATSLAAEAQTEHVTVIGPGGRHAVAVSHLANVPMVPVDELIPFVGGSLQPDSSGSEATFSVGERSAKISSGRSLVPVDGQIILLSSPVTARAGKWFVPLDFLGKVIPLLTQERVTYREESRLLVLGEGFPHLSVKSFPYPAYTRIVLESSTPIDYRVTQLEDAVRVSMPVGYLQSDFATEELRDGVVEEISLGRNQEGYLLTVELGDRFGTMKAFELESPSRMVLDLFRSRVPSDSPVVPPVAENGDGVPTDVEATPEPEPVPEPPRPAPPRPVTPDTDIVTGTLRTITLDPGHGGSESGATGAGGLEEKRVTLAVARRLRRLLESRLGVRVLLTRDSDTYLSLDDRTAIANNNKSDIFISIHANASPKAAARGSEVYFLSYEATDDEARRVAASENSVATAQARLHGDADLSFILWDMAQAAYLNESASLAEMLQEELRAGNEESRNRGIKQAPFRVLMGATMPAALIEIGFITNPQEEQRLGATRYQDQIAQAIFRGILKYKTRFERQAGARDGHPGVTSGQDRWEASSH